MTVLSEPCKPWGGRLNDQGYGTDGQKLAHRTAYEREVGPIPAGMTIDHLCHSLDPTCPGGKTDPHRACTESTHLEPVPHGTNVRRGRNHFRDVTHCPRGHEYTEENTMRSGGARYCKTCRNAQQHTRAMARDRCKQGHPFDGVSARGYRTCSICRTESGKYAMAVRWHGVTTPYGQSPPADASR